MSDYRIEFPDFPVADMVEIPKGFEDASWHNDAAPSFHNRTLRLSIFVDYVDINLRDGFAEESPRFHIFKTDEEGAHLYQDETGTLSSDDWNDILDYVMAAAAVARGYVEQDRYKGDVREFWNEAKGFKLTIDDCGCYEGSDRYQFHICDEEGNSERSFDVDADWSNN